MKRIIPLIALIIFLSGCAMQNPGPLNPKGQVGEDQLWLILFSLGIMVLVMAVVFGLLIYVLIRYRKRKNQQGIPEQIEGNYKLEITWTIIPLVLLFLLAIPTITMTFDQAEDFRGNEDVVQVKVSGHQYWWEFEYTDYGFYTAQELVIPVNTLVQYELHSDNVNHSFWLPPMGGKKDNMVGLTNILHLDATETGLYRGRCAELCGESHWLMNFHVKVVTDEEFEAWVEQMQQPYVLAEEHAEVYELFESSCLNCHAIDSNQYSSGPNLAGFANRAYIAGFMENTEENLYDWIEDPQRVKKGNFMHVRPLTSEQIQDIVEFMNTLK